MARSNRKTLIRAAIVMSMIGEENIWEKKARLNEEKRTKSKKSASNQKNLRWTPWGNQPTDSKVEEVVVESLGPFPFPPPVTHFPKPIGFERVPKKGLEDKPTYASALKTGLQVGEFSSVACESDAYFGCPPNGTVELPKTEVAIAPAVKPKTEKYCVVRSTKKSHSPAPTIPTAPVIGSTTRYAYLKNEEIDQPENVETVEYSSVMETKKVSKKVKRNRKTKLAVQEEKIEEHLTPSILLQIVNALMIFAAIIRIAATLIF